MKKLRHIAAAALGAIVLAGTCSFSACGKGANVIKKDSYTADNRLILEYYGVDIDTLQAMTNDTKLIVDYIENKFQVDFKFITGTATTWLETLNRNIAVGDVPDLLFHDAKDPSYSTWLKEKYLYDFGTQLDKYPNLTAQFAKYSEEMKDYLGGAWYGLPLILDEDAKGTVVSEHAMYYRRDWYEKVKDYIPSNRYADENHRTIKDPEAADFDYIDFYNLCEAFAKGDPDGAGTRCLVDCPHVNDCRYSAKSIYVDNDRFPWYSWQCLGKPYEEATREEKTQSLKTFNPHGECAFKVQSDLVDHQAVILQFSDGSTATHSMIQGSVRPCRTIRVTGTEGEIEGMIETCVFHVRKYDFANADYTERSVDVRKDIPENDHHAGGDEGIIRDFIRMIRKERPSVSCTKIQDSIYGHLCVYKADKSMDEGRIEEINEV